MKKGSFLSNVRIEKILPDEKEALEKILGVTLTKKFSISSIEKIIEEEKRKYHAKKTQLINLCFGIILLSIIVSLFLSPKTMHALALFFLGVDIVMISLMYVGVNELKRDPWHRYNTLPNIYFFILSPEIKKEIMQIRTNIATTKSTTLIVQKEKGRKGFVALTPRGEELNFPPVYIGTWDGEESLFLV